MPLRNDARFERFVQVCICLGLSRRSAAELIGMNYKTFTARVLELGVVWPYEAGGPHHRVCKGVTALAALYGIPRRRIAQRIRAGMSLFEACHAR